MSEEFITDIYITPKPKLKFKGKLELDNNEKSGSLTAPDNASDSGLEAPGVWSFYWRSVVWVVGFSIISMLLISLMMPMTDLMFKVRPTISYGLLAVSFLAIAMLYKGEKIKPFISEKLHIEPIQWHKMNQLMMFTCLVIAALNIVLLFLFPSEVWAKFKLVSSLLILIVPVAAAAYVVALMARINRQAQVDYWPGP